MTIQSDSAVTVVPAGRFKRELEIVRTLKHMLESIKAWGAYTARIVKKIHGGPEHQGIEISEHIEYSSVRVKVQSGDNGTRFLCYIKAENMLAADLLKLLTSKVDALHWHEGDEFPRRLSSHSASQTTADSQAEPLPTPQEKEAVKIGSGRLSAYAHDAELRDIVMSAFRAKFGDGEFKGRDFHMVIASLAGQPAPTTKASGQLIRRYCEMGFVTKVRTQGFVSYYRLVGAEERLLQLRAVAAKLDEAEGDLEEISRQEKTCAAEARVLRDKLQAVEDRLEELAEQKIRLQETLADPELREARAKVKKIEAILKK